MSIDYHLFSHAGIRSLIPYKPGTSIEEVMNKNGITNVIKMASNENPLGCSPLALSALQHISAQTTATYPSPINHVLMSRLANQLKISVDQLFLSNGSDYLFGMLLYCFALHNEKHIITHDYAFSTYAIQAQTLNIPVHTVAINSNWTLNLENIIQACNDDSALIFLANPNNPTGLLVSQNEILYLLSHIPKSTLLVLDEAYFEYVAAKLNCSSIDWLAQYPNLVITRTFSKIYGMAGLRLGYAMAHPSIISLLQRVQLPFSVNQAALTAGNAALYDTDFIQLSLSTNDEGMVQMRKGLDSLGLSYLPSECNFLTIDCKEDGSIIYHYLLENGIIVRPLHAYKMNQYIRVTIGTKAHNLRFLNALEHYYGSRK